MLNKIIQISSNSVDIAEVSVGQHYYWEIVAILFTVKYWWRPGLFLQLLQLLHLQEIDLKQPEGLQNLTEYITEFIRDLAKTQIGEEEYVKWVPFLGSHSFCLKLVRALIPWHLIETKWRISCTNKWY
jgi:F-type H+-transporting ATPase subunit a